MQPVIRRIPRLLAVSTSLLALLWVEPMAAGAHAHAPARARVPSWRILDRTASSAPADLRRPRGTLPQIAPQRLDRLHHRGGAASVRGSTGPVRSRARALTTKDAFDTITAGQDGPIVSPGDPTGAVGPAAFVVAVNIDLAVYDRSGTVLFGPARLGHLYPNLPAGRETDPKVVYDAYSDRFVLVFLMYSRTSSNLVVVTIPGSTADQKSTWCPLVLSGDQVRGNGLQQADYPGLGFTQDRVVLSTDSFDATGRRLEYSQVVSMEKSQLYDCGRVPRLTVFADRQTRDPDGSAAATIQPAVTVGGGSPTTQYLASFDWNGPARASDLVVWRLAETAGGPRLVRTALRVGKVSVPPWGRQCGASPSAANAWWDTGDLRLTSAFYDADTGELYTAHAVRASFGGGPVGSAVRWYDVAPAPTLASSTLARRGLIGGPGLYDAWPSVATDGGGTLFVNYSEGASGPSGCLSIDAATVAPGSAAASSVAIRAGDSRYEYAAGPERWGDFSAIARDPADPTQMGIFNAYAPSSGGVTSPLFRGYAALVRA